MLKRICAALTVVLLLIGPAVAGEQEQVVRRDYIVLDKDREVDAYGERSQVTARQFILLDKETDDVYLFRGEKMLNRAATGMRLITGDFVITGTKALAFFQADASKFFQLGPSGSVAILKSGGPNLVMSLKTGEFYFNILSPLGGDETLIIEAGNTTMSIRGTSGYFSYKKHKNTEMTSVEIYSGKVSMIAGDNEYVVESGKALTVTSVDDTVTATERKAGDGLPDEFASRVSLAVQYESLGQPMPTTAIVSGPGPGFIPGPGFVPGPGSTENPGTSGIVPLPQPTPTAAGSQGAAGVNCPSCGAAVPSENDHKCGVCGNWTCGPGGHVSGGCITYTCLNCGMEGLPSPGAHICKICERWMCFDGTKHGNGACNAVQSLRCPTCLEPVHNLYDHVCGYCHGFTCKSPAHGIGVCVFSCPVCWELVPSELAHKCDYPGCDGYICDMNH